MRPEAAFPYVSAAEGAQHPPKKPPRSTFRHAQRPAATALQAKPFSLAATENRIGCGPRSRYGHCRRAIPHCSSENAASILKSGLEIKNRCTQEGVNRQNPASIRKSGPEIKNRCTQEGINRQNLASIPKSGLEIKNRCMQQAIFSTRSLNESLWR